MSGKKTKPDAKLPITEHLKELKSRLAKSLMALFFGFVLCYYFAGDIYQFLVEPLADIYEGQENRRLIYTGLTEAFFTYMKIALFGGFIVAFPVIAAQLYLFASPALFKEEKKVALPFLIMAPVLFILGAAMVYYFIFPQAWRFFLSFEAGGGAGALPIQLEAKVSEYLSLVMHLIFAFGVAFQLPVVLMLLARAGFASSKGLRKNRKYALIAIVTAAAILTPPDVISQIGLALPLLLLYECSIFACRWVENEKVRKNA